MVGAPLAEQPRSSTNAFEQADHSVDEVLQQVESPPAR